MKSVKSGKEEKNTKNGARKKRKSRKKAKSRRKKEGWTFVSFISILITEILLFHFWGFQVLWCMYDRSHLLHTNGVFVVSHSYSYLNRFLVYMGNLLQ